MVARAADRTRSGPSRRRDGVSPGSSPGGGVMDTDQIRHPTTLTATCLNCEEQRAFRPVDADPDDKTVIYVCQDANCSHTVGLDLDC